MQIFLRSCLQVFSFFFRKLCTYHYHYLQNTLFNPVWIHALLNLIIHLFIHRNISRQTMWFNVTIPLIHATMIYRFLTVKLRYTRTETFSVPCPVTISFRDLNLITDFLSIHKAGNDSWAVINIQLIKSFNWLSQVNKKSFIIQVKRSLGCSCIHEKPALIFRVMNFHQLFSTTRIFSLLSMSNTPQLNNCQELIWYFNSQLNSMIPEGWTRKSK